MAILVEHMGFSIRIHFHSLLNNHTAQRSKLPLLGHFLPKNAHLKNLMTAHHNSHHPTIHTSISKNMLRNLSGSSLLWLMVQKSCTSAGWYFIPLFTGFYTSQVVVWDFFYQ